MLFRTVVKDEFRRLVDIMLVSHEVIGPRKIDTAMDGKPIHQFLPVQSLAELDLDYETTEISAKTYFLPYKENLSVWRFDDGRLEAGDLLPPPAPGHHRPARLRHQRPAQAGQGAGAGILPQPVLPLPAQEHLHRRHRPRALPGRLLPVAGNRHGRPRLRPVPDRPGRPLLRGDRLRPRLYDLSTRSTVAEVSEQDTADYLDVRRKIAAAFRTRIWT